MNNDQNYGKNYDLNLDYNLKKLRKIQRIDSD